MREVDLSDRIQPANPDVPLSHDAIVAWANVLIDLAEKAEAAETEAAA